jgi:wyosine [tRNA(Phe)-imidazoG37] synthetase (radical SAM superfamily)
MKTPQHHPHATYSDCVAHGEPSPLPTRNFQGNQFVYCVLSQRAGGLSVGIDLAPDKRCNFRCVYCEVDRKDRRRPGRVQIPTMLAELEDMLAKIQAGKLAELGFPDVDPKLLPLKSIALSGDGEPTLCPNFREILEAVVKLRARGDFPFFKIVLITNSTGLQFPETRAGIDLLSSEDEVWAKLDAGTQSYMNLVNHPGMPIDLVLRNIRDLAQRRPVVIQSLFPAIEGAEPPEEEVLAYARTLRDLRDSGAQIPQVQIYSAHRAAMNPTCGHLPLRSLSRIAQTVREVSGLNAEVF